MHHPNDYACDASWCHPGSIQALSAQAQGCDHACLRARARSRRALRLDDGAFPEGCCWSRCCQADCATTWLMMLRWCCWGVADDAAVQSWVLLARTSSCLSPALAPRQRAIEGQRPASAGRNLIDLLARETNVKCLGIGYVVMSTYYYRLVCCHHMCLGGRFASRSHFERNTL